MDLQQTGVNSTFNGIITLNADAVLRARNSDANFSLGTGSIVINADGGNGTKLELESNSSVTFVNAVTIQGSGTAGIAVNNLGSNSGNTLTLGGPFTMGAQTLSVTGGNNYDLAIAGNVTLTDMATINVNTTGVNATIGGAVSGSGGLTKTGSQTLVLGGSGTYSGTTVVVAGKLQAMAADVLSANSAVTVDQGAVLDLNGFDNTIGSLTGTGTVQPGGGTLTVGADNTSTTFTGTIAGAPGVSFPNGFGAGQMQVNGSATLNGTALQLVPAVNGLAGSAFLPAKIGIAAFSTSFTFQFTGTPGQMADGLTFTIQGNSPTALGGTGGLEGYQGIGNSIAVKFDAYHNNPAGQTGLFTGGANPGLSGTNITGGLSLDSGDIMRVDMTYDGTTLSWTITDTANPSLTFSNIALVNIPNLVGGSTAYVGFTAATGGLNMIVNVRTLNFIQSNTIPSGGLTKIGMGTQTLAGLTDYTGVTTVTGGTLFVASPGTLGNVTVSGNGATFADTGTVGSVTASTGGTVSLGTNIGTLTAGSLDLSNGGNLLLRVAGYTTAGTSYDCLNLGSGSLTVDDTSTLTLDLGQPARFGFGYRHHTLRQPTRLNLRDGWHHQ